MISRRLHQSQAKLAPGNHLAPLSLSMLLQSM